MNKTIQLKICVMIAIWIFAIAFLLVCSPACSLHKQVTSEAQKIEALYSETLDVIEQAQIDQESRAKLQDIRRRAELLWQTIKDKYTFADNPWLQILKALILR